MKALVLCGGMPQQYLVKLLKQRNIKSIVADLNPDAPAIRHADVFYPVSSLDVCGIREIAKIEQVDFLISVCADQMLLVVAQISEELGLPCYISFETAKDVSDKERMKKLFSENGIPTSPFVVSEHFDPDKIAHLKYPLVVKPVDAYSSRGVIKVDNSNLLEDAFVQASNVSRTGRVIIEEYIQGDELSVDLYVENGNAKILCIRALDKIPGLEGFIICRGRYPASISNRLYKRIEAAGQRIAEAFSLENTPMLIQLKTDGNDISIIEFCARTGGGIKYRLIPEITGFDVVEAVLDLTLGHKPHYDGERKKKFIVDEFIYCQKGILDHVEGFDILMEEGVIDHYAIFKQKGYTFNSISSSGDRVAYYSVSSDNFHDLMKKHSLAGKMIHIYDMNGRDLARHDIIELVKY